MAKVVKGELKAMASGSIVALLLQDSKDAGALINSINSFVNSSRKKLTGPNYDEARKYMSEYVPVLSQRKQAAAQLASAIKGACNSLASYMGKFDVLDDAERAEYESNLKSAQDKLNYLSSLNCTDPDFNFFNYWATYFNCKEIIKLCTEYLEKLDGLPGADAGAFGQVSAAADSFKVV